MRNYNTPATAILSGRVAHGKAAKNGKTASALSRFRRH
jgi:hypothetical protein